MEVKSLDEIVNSLEDKCDRINTKMKKFNKLNKSQLDMSFKNVELITKLNQDLNSAEDKIDDIYLELLKYQDPSTLNHQQKELVREANFNGQGAATLAACGGGTQARSRAPRRGHGRGRGRVFMGGARSPRRWRPPGRPVN